MRRFKDISMTCQEARLGGNCPDWMCITSALYEDVYINAHRLDYLGMKKGGGKGAHSRATPALDAKVDEYLAQGGRQKDMATYTGGKIRGGFSQFELRGKNFGARVGRKDRRRKTFTSDNMRQEEILYVWRE